MNKEEAIKKLEELKKRAEILISMPIENPEFEKWHRDTRIAIEKIFGKDAKRYLDEFNNIDYTLPFATNSTPEDEFERAYQDGIKRAIAILDSFISEIKEYW